MTIEPAVVAQLTRENASELIEVAKHRTAEQVRELLADRKPRPEVPACARRIPEPPSSPSRDIPAAIRREISRREGERCTYVSTSGRRCGSREFLEFHHLRRGQEGSPRGTGFESS